MVRSGFRRGLNEDLRSSGMLRSVADVSKQPVFKRRDR